MLTRNQKNVPKDKICPYYSIDKMKGVQNG